jgi:hypothetical protein
MAGAICRMLRGACSVGANAVVAGAKAVARGVVQGPRDVADGRIQNGVVKTAVSMAGLDLACRGAGVCTFLRHTFVKGSLLTGMALVTAKCAQDCLGAIRSRNHLRALKKGAQAAAGAAATVCCAAARPEFVTRLPYAAGAGATGVWMAGHGVRDILQGNVKNGTNKVMLGLLTSLGSAYYLLHQGPKKLETMDDIVQNYLFGAETDL